MAGRHRPLALVPDSPAVDELKSEFVFAANGTSGVAHNVTVTALVDGTQTGSPYEPLTIETRHPSECEF